MRHLHILSAGTCFVGLVLATFSVPVAGQDFKKLIPSDGAPNDVFGISVAASSDLVVVGATCSYEWDPCGPGRGSVYVYRFDGIDWTEEIKLAASDGQLYDRFGSSVAAGNGFVAVAADSYRGGGPMGAAYVFRHDATSWDGGRRLRSSDDNTLAAYGFELDADGDVVVVSGVHSMSRTISREVYVFRADGKDWVEEARLTTGHLNHSVSDAFGDKLALAGDLLLVSAPYDSDIAPGAGAVYIYRFDNSVWNLEQKLVASDGREDLAFGTAVSVSGDHAIVGARSDSTRGYNAGAAYVFHFDGSRWVEVAKLVPDGLEAWDQFGAAVAVSGDKAIVGAFGDRDGGAVYRYSHDGVSWTPDGRYALASQYGYLGASVAASDPVVVAGSVGATFVTGSPEVSTNREPDNEAALLRGLTVSPNYPNPFTSTTRIRFELSEPAAVHVAVYDLMGRHVATLANEVRRAGVHEVEFDGSELPTGLYLARVAAGANTAVVRLARRK